MGTHYAFGTTHFDDALWNVVNGTDIRFSATITRNIFNIYGFFFLEHLDQLSLVPTLKSQPMMHFQVLIL